MTSSSWATRHLKIEIWGDVIMYIILLQANSHKGPLFKIVWAHPKRENELNKVLTVLFNADPTLKPDSQHPEFF